MKTKENIKIINDEIISLNIKISDYKKIAIWTIIIGFALLIFGWLLFYFSKDDQVKYLTSLGSFAGGIVSSLFSLAGLFYIYVAFLGQQQQILYQRIDLEYNKEELLLTRNEIKNQSKEMKLQNETLMLQNFENKFFQLLTNYQKSISLFYVIMDMNFFNKFIEDYRNKIPYNATLSFEERCEIINVCKLDESILDYTFVFQLKNIILYLMNSQVENKDFYIDNIKSILSETEKKSLSLILNYDESLDQNTKQVFEASKLLNNYKINEDYFERGELYI